MTTGIILFAHGSRDPQWRLPIEAVARQITQRQPEALVRCAYLELCLPSLPDAATDLIANGASRIKVFPLFLGVGKHAREDLPLLIHAIRQAHPSVTVELLPTAGESGKLTELLAEMALA
jgi:sirohydrochlorin cobaltochelatase